jgi:hypothetical protein
MGEQWDDPRDRPATWRELAVLGGVVALIVAVGLAIGWALEHFEAVWTP